MPLVVPLLAATRYAGHAYARRGPRALAILGCVGLATGLAGCAVAVATGSAPLLCAGLVPVGAGIGLLMTPMQTFALDAAPLGRHGRVTGVVTTARQLGAVVGVALFVGVGAPSSVGGTATAYVLVVAAAVAAVVAAATSPRRALSRAG